MDALKKVEDHLPEGVDGLSSDQAKMIEGAITFQTEVVSSVMSPIKKIDYMITMETVLDEATLDKILNNGYSRIPVIKDGNKHLIIGILLAKSLIGLEGAEKKTLAQHYREKRVQVRIPLYIHTDASLAKMVVNMKTGFSHMAVVLNTPSAASELRDIADDYHRDLTTKPLNSTATEPYEEDIISEEREVAGILTLENVIERILQTDIHDEKDMQNAKSVQNRMQTIVYRNTMANPNDTSLIGAQPRLSNEGDIFKSNFVNQYY